MNDAQLLRYSRHLLLPEFGTQGQERLGAASALVVGLGGLGSPVALYLAAAGIGGLVLADGDRVEISNLQRQILHDDSSLGQWKSQSAASRLRGLNPEVTVTALPHSLDAALLDHWVPRVDMVLDCSDNFSTRFAINAACFRWGRPLVSGAAIRWEGQVAVFSGQSPGPCYRCLYPEDGDQDLSCTANGVLAPLVGVIGSLQATEAIKYLCGLGDPAPGRLLLWDALRGHWRSLHLPADPQCPVCQAASQ